MTPTDTVLARLRDRGCNPKKSSKPGQWDARCPHAPGHKNGDKHPSLSVGEGRDGNTVIHCQTGCPVDNVVAALGLTLADLYPEQERAEIRRPVAIYDYHDEQGTLVFQAVRYDPKTFRQRQPDGRGGWTWNLQGIDRRPLYRLPQTLAAVANGDTIWIAEGEKDVHALEQAGQHATCNPMGAGKWRPEHTEWLTGAQRIDIVADDDQPGREHAQHIADTLTPLVADLHVWLPAQGCKDIAEHLGQGRPLNDLRPLDDQPPPQPGRLRANLLIGSAILDLPPVEWLIHETIQVGGLTVVYGPPKSFKTFATLDMTMHIANGQPWRDLKVREARVLYVVAEGAPGVGPRARAWCQRFGGSLENMAWITVAPDLFNRTTVTDETQEVADIALELGCGVVVVDTLARAMAGAEENSAKDMGLVIGHLDLIKEATNAAVIAVHHTGKDQARGMRGSNSLQGAVDTSLEVIGDKHAVNVRVADQKNAEAERSWWWKPEREDPSLVLTPTNGLEGSSETRDFMILKQLELIDTGGGVTSGKWEAAVVDAEICRGSTFEKRKKALYDDGLVTNEGTRQLARWALTPAGVQHLTSATRQ